MRTVRRQGNKQVSECGVTESKEVFQEGGNDQLY